MVKTVIKIVLFAFLFAILVVFWQKRSNEAKAKKANLIIVSVDALKPDHMGIYGYKKNTTPNIDKWSKNAFVFDQASTVIPITYPSFSALFTGLHPAQTKITRNSIRQPISDQTQTLVSILKKNNFVNAAYLTSDLFNKDINKSIANLVKDFDVYETFPYKDYQTNNHKDYEGFIGKAFSWLAKNKDKKKFLWLHLMNTHPPFYPPLKYQCIFGPKYCQEIKSRDAEDLAIEQMNLRGCQKQIVPENKVELYKTLYDGEIAYMDKLFGQLIANLKKNNLEDNTIIVFLSDHGEGFDHNYNFFHGGVLYNSSLRIPLIVKIPWMTPRVSKIDGLINNTDIMPTIIDLLGLKTDSLPLDGISFKDKLPNSLFDMISLKSKRRFIYSMSAGMDKYAIMDDKYKYIYSFPGSCLANNEVREELYDLEADPNEQNDLFMINQPETYYLKKGLMNFLLKYKLPMLPNERLNNLQEENPPLEELKSLGY